MDQARNQKQVKSNEWRGKMRYLEKADVDLNTGLFNVYLKKCPDIKVYEDEYYCTTNNPKNGSRIGIIKEIKRTNFL